MRTAKYEGIAIKPTKERDCYMVGQSQSSPYAHGVGHSVSGGVHLEEFIDRYLAEGGYVIDKRHLPWEIACAVISGPMDKVGLPPMTLEEFGETRTFESFDAFFSYLEERKKAFDGSEGLSMAYLSVDLYAEWWRRKGAKVGRKVAGNIQWKAPYSAPLFDQ
jgi:hypothetical protein